MLPVVAILTSVAVGYIVGRREVLLLAAVVFAAIFAVAEDVDAPRWAVASAFAVPVFLGLLIGYACRRFQQGRLH